MFANICTIKKTFVAMNKTNVLKSRYETESPVVRHQNSIENRCLLYFKRSIFVQCCLPQTSETSGS